MTEWWEWLLAIFVGLPLLALLYVVIYMLYKICIDTLEEDK